MNVAFLQNQWFHDPERVKGQIAKHSNPERYRRALIRYALFAGCLTGRRIKAAFGYDLIDSLRWEEVSREIGGHASSVFPPDLEHIRQVIEAEQPKVVLAFGTVALAGLMQAGADKCILIAGPHPAARGANTVKALQSMAEQYRSAVGHAHA